MPSIGNAVSDLWDIVYGQERNLDINWNSLKGLRLALGEDGYQYNSKEGIETLAGCINSVHDLMGMIIEQQPDDAEYASNYAIYWDGEKFNRRKIVYDYSNILSVEKDYEFIKVEDAANNYMPNTYFLDAKGSIRDEEGKYNSNNTYYKRKLLANYIKTKKMN